MRPQSGPQVYRHAFAACKALVPAVHKSLSCVDLAAEPARSGPAGTGIGRRAAGPQWAMDRLPGWTASLGRGRAAPAGRPPPGLAGAPLGAAGGLRAAGAARGPAALAGAAMVAWSASAGWPANDRSANDFAARYAEVVFDVLPPDAVLFVYGDAALGPIGYYRYVEERRPDVALYSLQGLVFGNRLFDPPAPMEERQRALDRFVRSTERAVFLLPDFDIRPSDRGFEHRGFVLGVRAEGTGGTVDLTRDERGERYFLELLDRRPADTWEQSRRNGLLTNYGYYLGLAVLSGSPLLLEPLACEPEERARTGIGREPERANPPPGRTAGLSGGRHRLAWIAPPATATRRPQLFRIPCRPD